LFHYREQQGLISPFTCFNSTSNVVVRFQEFINSCGLCESEKVKKVRETNRCKNVAGLKVGGDVAPLGFDQILEGDTFLLKEPTSEPNISYLNV
ncbi:hypothetical protein A4A49_53293, partial [Nicotiana attenuata]